MKKYYVVTSDDFANYVSEYENKEEAIIEAKRCFAEPEVINVDIIEGNIILNLNKIESKGCSISMECGYDGKG